MLTAFFDVQPANNHRSAAAPPLPPRPAQPQPPRQGRAKKRPKPSEASTTSVLAKFEPLAPEKNVPRAAEAAGRQSWQGLTESETKDDDLGQWEPYMEDEEECREESEDESEPDFEVDSLDISTDLCSAAGGPGYELSSSVEDATMPSLKAVFGMRRDAFAAQQQGKAVYAGPLLCCEADDDDFDY